MRNLAFKYLDEYKNWGCAGQQQMADIMVGFAELAVKKFTDTQQLKPAMPSFEELWSRIEQQYTSRGLNCENYHLAAVKDGARDMYKLVTAGV